MNIQAMMKQAQKLQKEMMEEKAKIDEMSFEASSSFVTVKGNGKKEIIEIIIDQKEFNEDDIEILQDVLVVAINNLMEIIDKETDKKMSKYTQGMPGLF